MYFFGLQILHPIVVVRKYPESVPSARLPIANAKVTHYYNCYNGYFVGCLPIILPRLNLATNEFPRMLTYIQRITMCCFLHHDTLRYSHFLY